MMRFLIVPNVANPYDQRMVQGLAKGLRELDQEAIAVPGPIQELLAAQICEQQKIDVLIQVNRLPPIAPPLPKRVRHISWYQDVFPDTGVEMQERLIPGDIVYALGDPRTLGLPNQLPCYVGSLLAGVDSALKPFTTDKLAPLDFSLCGYIPPPPSSLRSLRKDLLWYLRDSLFRLPLLGPSVPWQVFWRLILRRKLSDHVPHAISAAFRSIVESNYTPLRGELDIHALANAMLNFWSSSPIAIAKRHRYRKQRHRFYNRRLKLILSAYNVGRVATAQAEIDALISYYAREYPRLLDRQLLVRSALSVSTSLSLYGAGWVSHEEFRPYFKGAISQIKDLLQIYVQTRLNLMNNTHGLGLHSRTLECMAVGGFIFTHRSPQDTKPGGIETSFDPDHHYGVYTPDSFLDDAQRWLTNNEARMKAGQAAAAIVQEKHLWRHRAAQIMSDLTR